LELVRSRQVNDHIVKNPRLRCYEGWSVQIEIYIFWIMKNVCENW
jgi:hypothetical protein